MSLSVDVLVLFNFSYFHMDKKKCYFNKCGKSSLLKFQFFIFFLYIYVNLPVAKHSTDNSSFYVSEEIITHGSSLTLYNQHDSTLTRSLSVYQLHPYLQRFCNQSEFLNIFVCLGAILRFSHKVIIKKILLTFLHFEFIHYIILMMLHYTL